jgi:hypothetical protein
MVTTLKALRLILAAVLFCDLIDVLTPERVGGAQRSR